MNGKFFLDTNIIIYSFDIESPTKRARALGLIEEALKSGTGIISYQVIQEFLNVALTKFASPLKLAEAQVFLSMVLRPLCLVTSSIDLFDAALIIKDRYRYGFYDALIIAASIQGGCKLLYSEDLQHLQQVEGVTISNPFF